MLEQTLSGDDQTWPNQRPDQDDSSHRGASGCAVTGKGDVGVLGSVSP